MSRSSLPCRWRRTGRCASTHAAARACASARNCRVRATARLLMTLARTGLPGQHHAQTLVCLATAGSVHLLTSHIRPNIIHSSCCSTSNSTRLPTCLQSTAQVGVGAQSGCYASARQCRQAYACRRCHLLRRGRGGSAVEQGLGIGPQPRREGRAGIGGRRFQPLHPNRLGAVALVDGQAEGGSCALPGGHERQHESGAWPVLSCRPRHCPYYRLCFTCCRLLNTGCERFGLGRRQGLIDALFHEASCPRLQRLVAVTVQTLASQEARYITGVRLFNGQDAMVDGLEVWIGDHADRRRNQARFEAGYRAAAISRSTPASNV